MAPAQSIERCLQVFINQDHIGTLYENNGLWRFEYQEAWLKSSAAFSLSPSLNLQSQVHSDTGTHRPVQWFFDNLLPEEGARAVIARDVKVSSEDAFGLLEAVGSESAGAITLLHPGDQMSTGELELLTAQELSKRIRRLPRAPLNDRTRKRMSLAGAQHKMLVVAHSGHLYEPVGQMPSTHILKPEHSQPELYSFTVRNEYFVMSLARLCGLTVPDVAVDYLPEPVYLVERFDRKGLFPDQQRIHVLDGCQLLDLAASNKYRFSTIESLKQLANLCRTRAQATIKLYRWVLFNFFVGNNDAHLKNLSFTYARGGIALLPHYDLLSTVIYEPIHKHIDAELSQPLGNA
ncbi:HipA domain-containing protein, partial [Lacimicrobium alkaliphilum]